MTKLFGKFFLISLLLGVLADGTNALAAEKKAAHVAKKVNQQVTEKKEEAPPFSHDEDQPQYSRSQRERRWRMGPKLGLAIPGGSGATGLSARIMLGGDVNYLVTPNVALGVFFDYNAGDVSGTVVTYSFFTFGAEANYVCDSGFNAGLRLGLSSVSASVLLVSTSFSQFAIGPRLGWDFRISDLVTLGPDFSFMFLPEKEVEVLGIKATAQSVYLINIAAAVRFWF